MRNIFLAVSNEKLLQRIASREDLNVVGTTNNKDNIYMQVRNNRDIDLLFVTDGLNGNNGLSLIEILCNVKNENPNIRVIYLSACDVDLNDRSAVNSLSLLVDCGIYDIYLKKSINTSIINDLLDNPKDFEYVKDLYKFRKQINELPEKPSYSQEYVSGELSEGKKNVIAISSIKPGTGKSFVSTNIAAAIARYGNIKSDQSIPSVVIVEGDLQTLSVGTLLGIENNTYNLRSALMKAAEIIDEEGRIIGTYEDQQAYKMFLRKCCLQYKDQNNLFALVGSQLNFVDLESINPYQYMYMIEVIADMYDIVIIDANSSLEHRTTGPILQLASQCYYVLDLDFNNVRSNLRYRQELSHLGVQSKIKYILNRAFTKEMESKCAEKLDFSEEELKVNGFDIIGRIPMIDTAVTLNRMYNHVPIVYDKTYPTLLARMEFTQLANKIWPMSNALQLRIELDELKKSNGKKSKKKK